jgi:putative toxin-antitoxin system antitoxin component (TIGR02293 family)
VRTAKINQLQKPDTSNLSTAFSQFDVPTLRPLHFKEVFQTTSYQRVLLIKRGVTASTLVQLAKSMHTSQLRLARTLGIPKTTIARKILQRRCLSDAHAERIVGLAKMIGQVEIMASVSQSKKFNAPQWLGSWLYCPHPALGNHQPEELMDTYTGQEMVSTLLFQTQSGIYV